MLVALGLFLKLAVALVKNPVGRCFVLLLRVLASNVPLLNSALLLREGNGDTVGTSVASCPPEAEPAETVAVWKSRLVYSNQ